MSSQMTSTDLKKLGWDDYCNLLESKHQADIAALQKEVETLVEALRYMDGWLNREIEGLAHSSAAHARGKVLEALAAVGDVETKP